MKRCQSGGWKEREYPVTYAVPVHCPACSEPMQVTELTCPHCQTKVQGVFASSPLQRLTAEQLTFVEVFIRCRGNIREVERDLKISYPTVRSRLNQVIQSMGFALSDSEEDSADDPSTGVLEALDAGSLSFEEALEKLRRKER